jgi:hypothetical protein
MPAKPIRISGHARFEMGRRGISRADVLRVVVKEDANAYHVVTAYKTSKIANYWKNT